jgi:hypothetical protein
MPGRRSTRRTPAAVVLCLALFGALGLAGCSSDSQYVSNKSDHTYFKVPVGWKLFGEQQVVDATPNLSAKQRTQKLDSSWSTVFDADPKPSLGHWPLPSARYPSGYAVVASNSVGTADQLSDESMRNQFLSVDELSSSKQLEVLSYEQVNKGSGLHGIRIRARVSSKADSSYYPQGATFTFEQISLTNQARDKSYSLIVLCSATCFQRNSKKIEGVMNSWTVTDG